MDEWLSMVLPAPAGAALLAALAFAVPALGGSGGASPFRAIQLLLQAPLADLAPVLKTTPSLA